MRHFRFAKSFFSQGLWPRSVLGHGLEALKESIEVSVGDKLRFRINMLGITSHGPGDTVVSSLVIELRHLKEFLSLEKELLDGLRGMPRMPLKEHEAVEVIFNLLVKHGFKEVTPKERDFGYIPPETENV